MKNWTILLLICFHNILPAQTIDENFNLRVTKPPSMKCLDVQEDNKMLIGGVFDLLDQQITSARLLRFHPTGKIDSTFQFYDSSSSVSKVEVVGDKMYVLHDKKLNRIFDDGSLDKSFVATGYENGIVDFIIAEDQIYIATTWALYRLHSDGAVDTTFDMGYLSTASRYRNKMIMNLEPDGKIIYGVSNSLKRYHTNGNIDSTFTIQIHSNRDFGNKNYNMEVIPNLLPDLNYYLSGIDSFNHIAVPPLFKTKLNGQLDLNFSTNFNALDLAIEEVMDMHVLSNGNLIVLAKGTSGAYPDILFVIDTNGNIVPSFKPIKLKLLQRFLVSDITAEIKVSKDEKKIHIVGALLLENQQTENVLISTDNTGNIIGGVNHSLKDLGYISQIDSFSNRDLIIRGYFSSINGKSARGLTKINMETKQVDPTFDIPDSIQTGSRFIILPDDRVVVQVDPESNSPYEYFIVNIDGSVDFIDLDILGNGSYQLFLGQKGILFIGEASYISAESDTFQIARLDIDGSIHVNTSKNLSNNLPSDLRDIFETTDGEFIVTHGEYGDASIIKLDDKGELIGQITSSNVLGSLHYLDNQSLMVQKRIDKIYSLSRLNIDEFELTDLPITANDYIDSSVKLNDNTLMLGGAFGRVNDTYASHLALVDIEGNVYDPNLLKVSSNLRYPIQKIIKVADSIYVAGEYYNIGGTPAQSLAIISNFGAPQVPEIKSLMQSEHDAIILTFIDQSLNELSFEIERSTNNGDFELIGIVPYNQTNFLDTFNVERGNSYTYRIRSSNSFGVSPYSKETSMAADLLTADALTTLQPTIYPNPTTGVVNFDNLGKSFSKIELFDAQGHLLKSRQGSQTKTIDLSNYPVGLYLLMLEFDHTKITKKIMKE